MMLSDGSLPSSSTSFSSLSFLVDVEEESERVSTFMRLSFAASRMAGGQLAVG